MIMINTQWLLDKMGVRGADPETVEMLTLFVMRFQNAGDKSRFLKEALRKALVTEPEKISKR
jgi:hypothetical protein